MGPLQLRTALILIVLLKIWFCFKKNFILWAFCFKFCIVDWAFIIFPQHINKIFDLFFEMAWNLIIFQFFACQEVRGTLMTHMLARGVRGVPEHHQYIPPLSNFKGEEKDFDPQRLPKCLNFKLSCAKTGLNFKKLGIAMQKLAKISNFLLKLWKNWKLFTNFTSCIFC